MSQDSGSNDELKWIKEHLKVLLTRYYPIGIDYVAFVIMALALIGPYVVVRCLPCNLCHRSSRSIGFTVLGGLGIVSGCLLAGFIVNIRSKMRVADQEFILRGLEILAEVQKAAWNVAEKCVETKPDTSGSCTLKEQGQSNPPAAPDTSEASSPLGSS